MALPSEFAFTTSQDGELAAQSSGIQFDEKVPIKRRSHSFILPRRKSIVNHLMDTEESLLLKVDLFLTELERRLEFLERYGDMASDPTIALSRALDTLRAVRTRCSHVSSEVLDAGRLRLQVMVETLETRYHEAYAHAGSLSEKARVAVDTLDKLLADFEAKAYYDRLGEGVLDLQQLASDAAGAAGSLVDGGRRAVEEGLGRAQEAVHEGFERAQGVVDEGFERAMRAAETLEDHIQRAVTLAKSKGLITYEDLPVPFRINENIRRGYRFTESKVDCVRSMFGLSNELVNIWSHALGLVLVLGLALYFYPSSANFSLSTKADVLVAAAFFFAACQCLVCSTVWHTMNGIADVDMVSTFACVDYTGISLLIAASIITTEYTAFYCEPVSRWLYMVTTAVLGVFGVVIPWHPWFNGQDMAWARVAFFIGLGATGFLPMLQIGLARGPQHVLEFYLPIAKSIAVYVVGACVYASKFPERLWPGMFDYIGGSHNLWHMAVLGGIFFHYTAMESFFADAFRRAEGGCPVY